MDIILIVVLVWLPGFVSYILLQLYWWQVKEYRFDRFSEHLKTAVGQRLYLGRMNILRLGVLLVSLVPLGSALSFLLFYGFQGVRVFKLVLRGNLPAPQFTLRVWQTFTVSLFLQIVSLWWLFSTMRPNLFTALALADFSSPFFLMLSNILVGKFIDAFYKKGLLQSAEHKIYSMSKLMTIGITGSYGKTSTKEFLAQILSQNFKVLSTPGHVNTSLGIAKFVVTCLTKKHQVLVVEMGAYKQGEIKEICNFIHPKMAVLTAISNQHLALFGSMENIAKTKFELIEALPEDGVAILNGDDQKVVGYASKLASKKIFYSVKESTNLYASNIKEEAEGVEFNIHFGGQKVRVSAPLLGKQNIPNILAASAAALQLGMSLQEVGKQIAQLKSASSTMELVKSPTGATVIDDSYNISPQGVLAALEVLKNFKAAKKVVVLSPMLELGSKTEQDHLKVLKRAYVVADYIIWLGLDFADLVKDFVQRQKIKKMDICLDQEKALAVLKSLQLRECVVLFEGRNTQKIVEEMR